jgi:HemY protein
MKRLLLTTLIALLMGAGLVTLIVSDPGYVLIAYGNYTLESSVWIFLLALFLCLVSVYVLLRIVRSFLGSVSFVGRWYGGISGRQANKYTRQAFVAMLQGNHQRARKLFVKAAPNVQQSILSYWFAATLPGADEPTRRLTLENLQDIAPDSDNLVTLMQAEFLLADKHFDRVLELVKPLEIHGKKYPAVYRQLYQAYAGINDWENAVALLPMLQQHDFLNNEEWLEIARRGYWYLFDPELARRRDMSGKIFRHAWEKRPVLLKEDSALAARYARCLMALDNDEDVEVLLRHWLDRHWHTELVEIYGMVEGGDIKRQLKQAEKWLEIHGDDPALLLTLGRACMRNQLWSKARDYFEQSYRRQHRPDTCAELGRLLGNLGEYAKSEKYYREGLMNRIGRLPVLPQPQAKNL